MIHNLPSRKTLADSIKFVCKKWKMLLLPVVQRIKNYKSYIALGHWPRIVLFFLAIARSIITSIIMTSLFAHKVAQPTKWRFLPKNLSQLVIFGIGLAFTWVWGDKNPQNLIFKVNFLCQKSVLLFWYLFLLKLLD